MTTGATSSSAVGLVENPYCRTPEAVIDELGSDREQGLSQADVDRRLQQYGRNEIAAEKPPSMVAVALAQVRDPMNLMLIVVTLVSIAIGEVSTGVIVGLLIVLNVVLGSRQELKARASVDALAKLLNADLDRTPELKQALLVTRNRKWANWIAARMQEPGTVFVAVGAGHLAGNQSVQAELAKRKLKVERVRY